MKVTVYCLLVLVSSVSVSAAVIGLDAVHNGTNYEGSLGTGVAYENMRTELQRAGYTLEILPDLTAESLSACDAVFVLRASALSEIYTSQEISSLQSFVTGGKGLLAIAEGGYTSDQTYANFNELIDPYGVEVNRYASSVDGHVVSGFVPHAVTDGITEVGLDYQRRLISITSPAIDLTPGGGEDDFLAAVDGTGGRGNVVVMSDSAPFGMPVSIADTDIYQNDNRELLMNISAYLVPEPATVCLLVLGAFFARRKRAL